MAKEVGVFDSEALTGEWVNKDTLIDNALILNTPSGKCKVTNLYVDPVTGKLVVEYDNVPKS